MTITRDQIVHAIALEAKLAEVLTNEARKGVASDVPYYDEGVHATKARHAALQLMLDEHDRSRP